MRGILRGLLVLSICLWVLSSLVPIAASAAVISNVQFQMDQPDMQRADMTLGFEQELPISGNITYQGTIPSSLDLTLALPDDSWIGRISPDTCSVRPGENVCQFIAWVLVPLDVQQANYEVRVRLEGEDPDTGAPISFSGPCMIRAITNRVLLNAPITQLEARAGDEVTFSITIENQASIPDDFTLEAMSDNETFPLVLSSTLTTLSRGGFTIVHLSFIVPPELPDGDYDIMFRASSTTHLPSTGSIPLVVRVSTPVLPVPIDGLNPRLVMLVSMVLFASVAMIYLAGTEVGIWALLSMLALPLYSRIKGSKVLDHFIRGQIFGYVKANPGCNYMNILQSLELSNGVGAYHIQVLEREKHIKSVKDGIYRRFYPAHMIVPQRRQNLSRMQKDVLYEIQANPGISQTQISKIIGESKQVVNYHIKILSNAGLVRLERGTKNVACHIASRERVELIFAEDNAEGASMPSGT